MVKWYSVKVRFNCRGLRERSGGRLGTPYRRDKTYKGAASWSCILELRHTAEPSRCGRKELHMKTKKKIKKENKRGKTFVGFAPKIEDSFKIKQRRKEKKHKHKLYTTD